MCICTRVYVRVRVYENTYSKSFGACLVCGGPIGTILWPVGNMWEAHFCDDAGSIQSQIPCSYLGVS